MATVWCAAIECKWNKDSRCKAKSINLSDGHIHTVHQGYKHIWTCKEFELSDDARRMKMMLEQAIGEDHK